MISSPPESPGGRIHDHFDGANKNVFAENFGDEAILVRIRMREYFEFGRTAHQMGDPAPTMPRPADVTVINSGAGQADITQPNTWPVHIPPTSTPPAAPLNNPYLTTATIGSGANQRPINNYVTWNVGQTSPKTFMPTFNVAWDGAGLRDVAHVEGIAIDQHSFAGNTNNFAGGAGSVTGPLFVEDPADMGNDPVTLIPLDMIPDGSWDFWDNVFAMHDRVFALEMEGDGTITANFVYREAAQTLPVLSGIPNNGVVTMEWWLDNDTPIGNFWVVDEEDGWAYWANLLQPGDATSLLLESINVTMHGQAFFYAIDVEGQFATPDQAGRDGWNIPTADAPSDNANDLLDLITGQNQPPTPPEVEPGYEFLAGGRVWRVLSTEMGPTGHGSGDDILIISTRLIGYSGCSLMPMMQPQGGSPSIFWRNGGSPNFHTTAGGYNSSNLRAGLRRFFETQTWAHGLALEPGSTETNGFAATAAVVNIELTTSPGTVAATNSVNGAFALSISDVNFFLPDATGANGRQAQTSGGLDHGWWLRSPANSTSARTVNRDGAHTATQTFTAHFGARPAMLLSELPTMP